MFFLFAWKFHIQVQYWKVIVLDPSVQLGSCENRSLCRNILISEQTGRVILGLDELITIITHMLEVL